MKKFKIGIVGAGTVGKSLICMLQEQKTEIESKYSMVPELVSVATRTPSKISSLLTCPVYRDWRKVTEDPEIDIVVELVGGTQVALEIAESALKHSKTFITANKALISEKATTLFPLSHKMGVEIGFEASVAGAIPVIRTLRDSLAPNHFFLIAGILNGTTNFILTKMEFENLSYSKALAMAQELGYAEAEPSFDVEGKDVAHKIAILARLAFARHIPLESISTRGITEISHEDIRNAKKMGYRIKLLGSAKLVDGKILTTVQPVLISLSHPLANVLYENNAIFYKTNYSGPGMLAGSGAGGKPTASAVLSDILYYARRRDLIQSDPTLIENNLYPPAQLSSPNQEKSRYYIRFTTVDRPGVLSYISQILGKNQISISSVNQNESVENEPTSVLITTHEASLQSLEDSIREIDQNREIIQEATVAFPILENL